jgi:hypothetical protein
MVADSAHPGSLVRLLLPRVPGAGGLTLTGIKEVVVSKRFTLVFFVLLALAIAIPSFAAPMPSKTAANQSLDSRAADLAVVRDFTSNEQVAQALAARGFTTDQVNARVSQLSPQDLHQLANNLDQLQAAGFTRQEWIWVGLGALAALILVIALG